MNPHKKNRATVKAITELNIKTVELHISFLNIFKKQKHKIISIKLFVGPKHIKM
jgi:hypothetical protein